MSAGLRIGPRRNRVTHAFISVYDTAEAMLDVDAGKWTVVCESHHQTIATGNRAEAELAMATSTHWCSDCAAIALKAAAHE